MLVRRSVAVCAAILSCACAADSAVDPAFPTNSACSRRLFDAMVQSNSRRFMVMGLDRSQNHQAAIWAERTAGDVERAVGVLLPPKRWRTFRLVLADATGRDGGGAVETTVFHDGHKWVYRLLLRDASAVSADKASQSLVRLILSACVLDIRLGMPEGDVGLPPLVPEWVAVGLSDTMDPALRQSSAEAAFSAWGAGSLPPLAEFLGKAPSVETDPAVRRAMGAMVVRWIEIQPDRSNAFRLFFEAIADGRPLDQALISAKGFDSATVMADEWDGWMLRQRWIVHKPGVLTPLTVETLKAQLLLYPAYFATGLTGSTVAPREPAALLAHRREAWLPDAVRGLCSAVRLAALGRSDECERVASLYCEFFEGLTSRKSDRQLRSMLREADKAMIALERKARVGTADGE